MFTGQPSQSNHFLHSTVQSTCKQVQSILPSEWGGQVVAAPVLGKVAQVGTDRVAGTLLGGAAGYGSFVLAE